MNSLATRLAAASVTPLELKRTQWYQKESELVAKIAKSLTNQANADEVRTAVSELMSKQRDRLQGADSEKKIDLVHARFCTYLAVALSPLSEGDINTLQIGPIVQLTKLYMIFQQAKREQKYNELSEITFRLIKSCAFDLAFEAASLLPQDSRDCQFSHLSSKYAEFEEYDSALQVADKIEDRRTRSYAKSRVVHLLAETQQFEKALEIAPTIDDIGEREAAYGTIARELINDERVDEALRLMIPRDPTIKGIYVRAPRDSVLLLALEKHIKKSKFCLQEKWLPRAMELVNLMHGEEPKDDACIDIIKALMKYNIERHAGLCKDLADKHISSQENKDRAYDIIIRGLEYKHLPIALGLQEPYKKVALTRFVSSLVEQSNYDDARMIVTTHMNSEEELLLLNDKILLQNVKNSDTNEAVAIAKTIKDKIYRESAIRHLAGRILHGKSFKDAVASANTITDTETREHILWRVIGSTFNILNFFPDEEDLAYAREVAEKMTIDEYKNLALEALKPN